MIFVRPNLTFSLLLVLSIVVVGACNFSPPPSDRELEETLKANQSDFDTLIRMLVEDQDIVRLDDKYVFLSEGSNRNVPKERLGAYRKLFAKLRLERGFQRDKDNALRFIASSRGIVSISEKSYIHSTTSLTPLVDSLDYVIERDHGDQKPVYKKLHGDWYLYYACW